MTKTKEAFTIDFHSLLVRRRRDLGYTQEYVAECCNMTTRQIQSLEKGTSLPTFMNALRLSIVLEFSLDSLKKEVSIDGFPLPRD